MLTKTEHLAEEVHDFVYKPVNRRVYIWEARSAWPMFILSVLFFAGSVTVLSGVSLPPPWTGVIASGVGVIWLIFIGDFLMRLAMSGSPSSFIRTRLFELFTLVIPLLRPFLIVTYIWRLPALSKTPERRKFRLVVSVAAFAFLFVYVGSTLVWFVERNDPHANIISLADAIWWGFTTITTVGYGDFTPVTAMGRFVAVVMMVMGMIIIGIASATAISVLTDDIKKMAERATARRQSRLDGTPYENESAVIDNAEASASANADAEKVAAETTKIQTIEHDRASQANNEASGTAGPTTSAQPDEAPENQA